MLPSESCRNSHLRNDAGRELLLLFCHLFLIIVKCFKFIKQNSSNIISVEMRITRARMIK